MKAARIHEFGSPDVIRIEDAPQPTPNEGEILVRVAAAGVGPWDALLREGKIPVSSPLPLIVGADLSGVVEVTRPGLTKFNTGDEVFGLTNNQFVGAYAEYAIASETMVARKPTSLSFAEAASAPVVAVTAWQMLFDHAHARAGQTVLIHGAAGNVGAYAVQMARLDAAIDEAVPAHVLAAALFERFASRGEAEFQDGLLSAMRFGFGGHVEKGSGS